jgi:hypothetical protein
VTDPVLIGSHGYQAINRLNRQGRLNARVRLSFSCFGSIIGLPCVKANSANAVSGIGDDMLRVGGIGEEVLNLSGPIYPDPSTRRSSRYLARTNGAWSITLPPVDAGGDGRIVGKGESGVSRSPIFAGECCIQVTDLRRPSADTLARLRALGAGVVPSVTNVKANATTDHPPFKRIYDSGTRACMGTDALNVSPFPPL